MKDIYRFITIKKLRASAQIDREIITQSYDCFWIKFKYTFKLEGLIFSTIW